MRLIRLLALVSMLILVAAPALAAEGADQGATGNPGQAMDKGAMQAPNGEVQAPADPGATQAPAGGADQGAGGRAPGLSEQQLGPCSWVISGKAQDIKPDQNKITVSTDMGNQPLNVTAESKIRDRQAKEISLSDIKPGDRVVASFHRENGQNVVGHLYKLPEAGGAGGAAPGAEEAKPQQAPQSGPPGMPGPGVPSGSESEKGQKKGMDMQ
jgi:Cu/Ag efflux protein CusF